LYGLERLVETPLYISSSDRSRVVRSLPWALLLGIFFLGATEFAIRLYVPSDLYPYDFLTQEYRSLIHHLNEYGSADLCFLGSSRMREAIVLPEFKRLLNESGISEIRVESYAMSGAWAADVHSVMRNIIRTGKKPKLVIYGITPDQICNNRRHAGNTSLLWNLSDWMDHYGRFGTDRYLLPKVLLNEAKTYSHILRWRDGARLFVRNVARRQKQLSSPIRGELTPDHRDNPDSVITITPEDNKTNQAEMKQFYGDGTDWIDPTQYGYIEEIAKLCQSHGIVLVFLELPLTTSLHDNYPGSVSSYFMKSIKTIAERYGATFVTQAQLGLHLEDNLFIDFEHTNIHGARKITRALASKVVIPLLKHESIQPVSSGMASD
jgi:hypothetical protein